MKKQMCFTHHKETSKISEKYLFKTASDLWFWFIHGPNYTVFTHDCTCSCKSNYYTITSMTVLPVYTDFTILLTCIHCQHGHYKGQ